MQESNVAPAELRQVTHAVLELLLGGDPIPVETIVARSKTPLESVKGILNEVSAERDENDSVIGLGLSLEPTPHEYHVGEKQFFTWCGPDGLLYPAILDHTAEVTSSDPVSGDEITLTVTPAGVESVTPSTTVVSWARSPDGRDVRRTFCRYGRFFTGRDTAEQWQNDHPAIEILGVDEATEAVRQMAELL